jgi:hypothetical protein
MRPTAFEPKEEEVRIEVSFRLSRHLHTGVKTPLNSKLIPDWITKLQIPTKNDVTLISIGSGPGVRYKEHLFPKKIGTFSTCSQHAFPRYLSLKVKLSSNKHNLAKTSNSDVG